MQPAPDTWDETIQVGDTVRAFGNATGEVIAITPRAGMSPILTYKALHDVPSLKVTAGQHVNVDMARCRKV